MFSKLCASSMLKSSLFLSMFFRRCHIPFSLAIQRNNSYLPFSITHEKHVWHTCMSFENRISFPYCSLLCYYNNQTLFLIKYFQTSFHNSLPSCFWSVLLHRFSEIWIRHISKAAVVCAHVSAYMYMYYVHAWCPQGLEIWIPDLKLTFINSKTTQISY